MAFESAKQRFFNHLIRAMKTPTLIDAVQRDVALGHAAVIQIVSTGEALMERRLAEIPTEEWGDVQVDITPREYALDYLSHGFPTQLYEPSTDGDANLSSRPVYRDGQPVQCREAVERRDRMIERLASLARRVRLLRPMERPAIPLDDLAHSHWHEADRAEFVHAWEVEIAPVPELTDSGLHTVTGLLLPWKRPPNDSMRVYRLQTDDGERIIGRLVSPAWVAEAVEADPPTLAPPDAFSRPCSMDGPSCSARTDWSSAASRSWANSALSCPGFSDEMVERLKAIGLMSEIISWKLRLFVPTGTAGPAMLAELMERYPLVRLADKTAA